MRVPSAPPSSARGATAGTAREPDLCSLSEFDQPGSGSRWPVAGRESPSHVSIRRREAASRRARRGRPRFPGAPLPEPAGGAPRAVAAAVAAGSGGTCVCRAGGDVWAPDPGRLAVPGRAGEDKGLCLWVTCNVPSSPNGRGSPPTSSASSSSLTNDVAKQPVGRDLPAGRPGAPGPAGVQYTPHSQQFPRTRKMFDKGPDQVRSTVRPRCERRPCSPGRGPHPALRPQLCCTVCTGTTLRCHGALAPVAPCHGSLSWHLPRGLTVLPPSTWPHCPGTFLTGSLFWHLPYGHISARS